MNCTAIIATVGIVLSTLGVVGLFFFGMPYRTRMLGDQVVTTGERNPERIRIEQLYDTIARISLALIGIGSMAEIAALFI